MKSTTFGSWDDNGYIKNKQNFVETSEYIKIKNHYSNWIKKWNNVSERSKINKGRTVFVYGPPGTGKSSIIKYIASFLSYNLCFLNLDSMKGDTTINDYINTRKKIYYCY